MYWSLCSGCYADHAIPSFTLRSISRRMTPLSTSISWHYCCPLAISLFCRQKEMNVTSSSSACCSCPYCPLRTILPILVKESNSCFFSTFILGSVKLNLGLISDTDSSLPSCSLMYTILAFVGSSWFEKCFYSSSSSSLFSSSESVELFSN